MVETAPPGGAVVDDRFLRRRGGVRRATRTGTLCPLPPGVKHHLRTTASRPVQRPARCQDPRSTTGSPLAHVTSRVACGVAASAADGGTSPWSGAFALRQRF